jgi:hypothetical protein
MDQFSFVHELAKWQVDHRELTEEEKNGAILAWNLTHVDQEAMKQCAWMMLEHSKANYKAWKMLRKYIQKIPQVCFAKLQFILSVYLFQNTDDNGFKESRDNIITSLTDKMLTEKDIKIMLKILNKKLPCLKENPIMLYDVSEQNRS